MLDENQGTLKQFFHLSLLSDLSFLRKFLGYSKLLQSKRKQGPQFDLKARESSYDLWLALALSSIPQDKIQSVEQILKSNKGLDPTSEYLEK